MSMNTKSLKRKDFKYFTSVEARWRDMDVLGHINNATYLTYFESARIEYLASLGMNINRWEGDESVILASMKIDYFRQSAYPNTYDIGCRISRIGTKSFDILAAIFDKSGADPIVTGTFITIGFNYKTQETVPIPKSVRDAYHPF